MYDQDFGVAHSGRGAPNGTKVVGALLATLCQIASAQVHRAVIDKTGLTGLFDYSLEFNLPSPGPAGDDASKDELAMAAAELGKTRIANQARYK